MRDSGAPRAPARILKPAAAHTGGPPVPGASPHPAAMRSTSALLSLALVLACTVELSAQAALQVAPSGRATSAVTLEYPEGQAPQGAAPLTIRLDYGQPHLRGRALHTDSLVPYGQPWRTGANAATTLQTDVDLAIGGVAVPRGTYLVYTLPSPTGWELILQQSVGELPMGYDPARDFARIPLQRRELAAPLESLSMWLIPSREPGPARGELRLAWGPSELSTDWVVR